MLDTIGNRASTVGVGDAMFHSVFVLRDVLVTSPSRTTIENEIM